MIRQNRGNMKVIGITGGVGCGKSSVLYAIEKEYLCKIFLADDIANLLKEPGQRCYTPLVQLLGTDVLDEKACIDKKKMSDLIFSDKALLEKVNAIVHPAVKAYIREGIAQAKESKRVCYVFVEAALFIEAGYRDLVDCLWYIYADKEVRVRRLQEGRGYSTDKSESIMAKQLQEEAFRKCCDVVIDNSKDLKTTMAQVRKELENK